MKKHDTVSSTITIPSSKETPENVRALFGTISDSEDTEKWDDYSAHSGPLRPIANDREWQMYSYERPANCFWNGVANGLLDQGFTPSEIKAWMESKAARWLLDKHDMEIEELGYKLSKGEKPVK